MSDPSIRAAKSAAATAAVKLIINDTIVGLGTGSTVNYFLNGLAKRYKEENLNIECIATSQKTEIRAKDLGLPVIPFLEVDAIDITIDGADEVDSDLNLIKGGGGALLREKIVASASRRTVIIADTSKSVETLGTFPLPVEVIPFGWLSTMYALTGTLAQFNFIHLPEAEDEKLPVKIRTTEDGKTPFMTDQGNFLFDLNLGRIEDPIGLSILLNSLPGVVENGLFIDMADGLIIGQPDGKTEIFMAEYADEEG